MTTSRPPSSLDRELVRILSRAFAAHAGEDAAIDLGELQKALGLRNEYLARRVLKVLDRDGDGVVRHGDFLASVSALVAGTDHEKLEFAFRLHDHDDDGTLDRDELLRMITVSLAESGSSGRVEQPAEQLVTELLNRADRDGDGRLSFEEFEAYVAARPHLLRRMVRSEAIWIAPNEELLQFLDRREKAPPLARGGERGLLPWFFLGAFAVANLVVFGIVLGRGLALRQDPLMQLGRALGACLTLDGALILLPVMRRLLTRVRASWLGRVVPVDDAVAFHTIVGHSLFFLSLAHAAVFVVAHGAGHAAGLERLLFSTRAGLTGALLVAVFVPMWVCALSFVRRGQRFEFFYFTHLLYLVWFALLVVHAPKFVVFAGAAMVGFAIDQITRVVRRGKATTIVETQALRSGVVQLTLARPPRFVFEAGDYVFLRIPVIARHEWHPFTLSSAPEREQMTVHVRSLGNWTAALRRHVEEHDEPRGLVAYVDGPHGSPSAHIFDSRYAVLIGAGIGVTPFASVLESVVLRGNAGSERPSKLEHAHFFWLNRDQYAFEWFASLLRELEEADGRGMLDIHLCMTEVRAGAAELGLELGREAMRDARRSDFFTGFRTHTHLGPPDWERLLGDVVRRHAPESVDVFFCGPPALSARLRPVCRKLGMSFREEKF